MGEETSTVLEVSPTPGRLDGDREDLALVAAVRRGDDRAFERLYARYHRRIHAYALGMCKDHARAEDITQEVFVSALRRMRATERPIAFKPWIYEIAKNACIDQFRRSQRTEEVSLQADEGLAPGDHGRLVGHGPTPEAAVAAKQQLDTLCGAFGGLSDVHHEILVMRELEGHSYREIGDRLGMSRAAVESTLFRARRRLGEEYDELVSGRRCVRVQGIIATAARGRVGTRDSGRLARHVAHCQVCRREALAAGLDPAMLRRPLRSRVAEKVAGLLPLGPFARRWGGGRGTPGGGSASTWLMHLAGMPDPAGASWAKAVAALALLVAGVGVGTQVPPPTTPNAQADSAVPHLAAPARRQAGPASHVAPAASARSRPGARRARTDGAAPGTRVKSRRSAGRGHARGDAGARGGAGAGPGRAEKPSGDGRRDASSATPSTRGTGGGGTASDPVRSATGDPLHSAVDGTGDNVSTVVQDAGGAVGKVVQGAGGAVGQVVQGAGDTVGAAVDAAGSAVSGAVGSVTPAASEAPAPATTVTNAAGQAVSGTAGAAGNAVTSTTDAVAPTASQLTGALTSPSH